jgi:hypothetical protein
VFRRFDVCFYFAIGQRGALPFPAGAALRSFAAASFSSRIAFLQRPPCFSSFSARQV